MRGKGYVLADTAITRRRNCRMCSPAGLSSFIGIPVVTSNRFIGELPGSLVDLDLVISIEPINRISNMREFLVSVLPNIYQRSKPSLTYLAHLGPCDFL